MTSAVSMVGVSKTYRSGGMRCDALHNFNLEIAERQFVAVMGPSGSGKTTMLNLIAGLDTATAGRISVNGTRIDSLSSNKLAEWRSVHVGFVFQFYHLLPSLSAARNVELPLLLTSLSTKERRRKVSVALDLVGLSDRAGHKPEELSGGQQQRVAIARAIIADPELIVCDEPTGDLDRKTGAEVLDLLRALNRQFKKTIILVTHDPVATEYATRLVHVDKGRQMLDDIAASSEVGNQVQVAAVAGIRR